MTESALYIAGTKTLPMLSQETSEEYAEIQDGLALIKELPITTDDEQNFASEVLRDVKAQHETIETRRKAITGPLNTALREVNNLFRPAKQALEEAERLLKQKIAGYLNDKQEANTQAIQAAAEAETVEDAVYALSIVRTVEPPKGISMRKVWKFAVVVAEDVPREYLSVDPVKVEQAIEAHTNEELISRQFEIPGIVFIQDSIVTSRKV